jgi:hypothetical protein
MSDAVVPITSEPQYKEAIARWEVFWSLEDVGQPMWTIPTTPVLSAASLAWGVGVPEDSLTRCM